MNRIIYALAGALPLLGFAQDRTSSRKETNLPPFDADLYRRDVQCFSLHGSFLFWRVQEGALDYALGMENSAWGPTECYAQGDFKKATFNGDPGFRIALDFFRAPKYWQFTTEYTRLTASGSNSASKPSPSNQYLTGTWPQIFTNPVASAKSYIHVNYNVADVLISRVFFPNPHLRLFIIGGGEAARMNQFWKVKYVDTFGSFETKIANRWDFIGGGLKLGTTFDWYWFTDIYMTGGTTFSGLLGAYHNKAIQTTNFSPIAGAYNPSIPIRNTRFNDIRAVGSAQFYLGPSYQKNFPNQRLEIFLGYELNAWINLQEIYRSTTGGPFDAKETRINNGIFALQGLTFRTTIDF